MGHGKGTRATEGRSPSQDCSPPVLRFLLGNWDRGRKNSYRSWPILRPRAGEERQSQHTQREMWRGMLPETTTISRLLYGPPQPPPSGIQALPGRAVSITSENKNRALSYRSWVGWGRKEGPREYNVQGRTHGPQKNLSRGSKTNIQTRLHSSSGQQVSLFIARSLHLVSRSYEVGAVGPDSPALHGREWSPGHSPCLLPADSHPPHYLRRDQVATLSSPAKPLPAGGAGKPSRERKGR